MSLTVIRRRASVALLVVASTNCSAAEEPLQPLAAFDAFAGPMLADYCNDCHSGDEAESGLALDRLQGDDLFQQDRADWKRVLRRLRAGDMPPVDMPQPSTEQRSRLIDWINARLQQVDCDSSANPGHIPPRRLNRQQYRYSILDLLGVDFAVDTHFPPDELAYGFDNNAHVLAFSPALIEKYLAAASAVAKQAIPAPEDLPNQGPPLELSLGPGISVHDHGPGRRLFTNATVTASFSPAQSGLYAVCVIAAGEQAGDEPVRISVSAEQQSLLECDVTAEADEFDHFAALLPLEEGAPVTLAVTFLNDYFTQVAGDPNSHDRNLIVHRLSITGPHDFTAQAPDATRRTLLRESPSPRQWQADNQWQAIAEARLREFLPHAWRGRATDQDVQPLVDLLAQIRASGGTYQRAMQVALQAMLCSPRFLMLGPIDRSERVADTPAPVDDLELASRLSYFLWTSTPDARLLELAANGQLRDNLQTEVQRMLADPRAARLAAEFAGQWLETRQLQSVAPDPQLFPEFDDDLRRGMAREADEFFAAVVRDDLPVSAILDADFTYLNERLARHYGIEDVAGDEFRRVSLTPEQRSAGRGGVLGLASLLTVSSYPDRTSPVLRGKYVLGNLLGDEPPPPPPNVPALAPAASAADSATLRERLERHRTDPSCAGCHNEMDPLGFALESFDALGRLRERDAGQQIEDASTLPDGTTVAGAAGLRSLLLQRMPDFRRTLAEKLLTYALARGLEYYDHCAVEQILSETQAGDDRFSALVLAIVRSRPFLFDQTNVVTDEES